MNEYKDWFAEIIKEKYNNNFVPKDEIYRNLIVNIGDQRVKSKLNLE